MIAVDGNGTESKIGCDGSRLNAVTVPVKCVADSAKV